MASPSTVLLGEIDGASGRVPKRAPAEVGAGVADERPDEHVDDDPVAVGQVAQQHGVREGQADPRQAEHRHRHPGAPAWRGCSRHSTKTSGTQATKAPRTLAWPPQVRGHEQRDRAREARPGATGW